MGGGRDPNDGANIWLPEGSSHNFNLAPQKGKPVEGRVVADWEQKIGQLYIQGAQELDDEKRKEIYHEVQRLTQDNLPWIPLVVERIMAAVRDRIEGVQYPELGNAQWNIQDLRVQD
jgi:peptide/nickel transport system substrate-binding protein